MSHIGSAVKVKLGQLAERCDELLREKWPAPDWQAKLEEVPNRFAELRRHAKQLLGQELGQDFCDQTNPVSSAKPSRLEQRRALEVAITKAAELLRKTVAEK